MTPAVPQSTFTTRQVDALDAAFQPLDADLSTIAANGIATQANMEAETAGKVVTADTQHFGPSAAKCWAYVTVSGGTPTRQADYNISGIVDDGVGLLTITIATDFSSSNWAAIGLVTISAVQIHIYQQTQAAGSVQLTCVRDSDNAASDPAAWSFAGFGDQ